MKNFSLVKAFLFFLFIIAVFWYVSVYSRSVVLQATFSVSGEGKVVAVPDIAQISVGVLTDSDSRLRTGTFDEKGGKDLANLQKQNTEKMNSIISYVKEQGVDQKDIKTEYYNISPRYQYINCQPVILQTYPEIVRPCPSTKEIIGYTITQNISVKVRDLSKAGDILAGAVEQGANNVSGPNFTIDDPISLQNQAREEAIKQARKKAKSIAKAGDFKLGKLVSIQEGYYPIPYPSYGLGGVEAKDAGASPTLEPGSQEISVNINLVYEIR